MTNITASNTVQYSNDIQEYTCSATPVKIKELTITDVHTGSWRIVFDLLGDYDSTSGYGQIYKNGLPYGTLQTVPGYPPAYNFTTFSQDFTGISVSKGDKIQIYAYNPDAPDYCASVQNFRIEFTLPAGSNGDASFTSNPTGAKIWIDGIDQGVTTPDTIENLSTGSHTYTLKLTGYQDTTGSFSVAIATTTIVPTVTLITGTTGSASFTSTPSVARIWIDNVDQGVSTPYTISNLSSGSHNYRLVLTGYADITGSFTITSGQTTNVPVTFAGSLYITSVPIGASIYIDGILQ